LRIRLSRRRFREKIGARKHGLAKKKLVVNGKK
jgi:hypothetical protein